MALKRVHRVDDLAEELTRRLGIPFHATGDGTIAFSERLRVSDWVVPLLFDGHVTRDHEAIIPTDFVGHLLWPTLRTSRSGRKERPWWYCTLSPHVAEALLEDLRGNDEDTADGAWVIGEDVLVERISRPRPAAARRRRVA